MIEINRELARVHTAEYTRVFDALWSAGDSGFLIHCAAGKDRTGFGVAAILFALGVPRDVVIDDYLLTNEAMDFERFILPRLRANYGEIDVEEAKALSGVRLEYIHAALDEVDATSRFVRRLSRTRARHRCGTPRRFARSLSGIVHRHVPRGSVDGGQERLRHAVAARRAATRSGDRRARDADLSVGGVRVSRYRFCGGAVQHRTRRARVFAPVESDQCGARRARRRARRRRRRDRDGERAGGDAPGGGDAVLGGRPRRRIAIDLRRHAQPARVHAAAFRHNDHVRESARAGRVRRGDPARTRDSCSAKRWATPGSKC